jgi:hypothetical protein
MCFQWACVRALHYVDILWGIQFEKYWIVFFFSHGATSAVGRGVLIMEASLSHSDTPHSVGLHWTSDQHSNSVESSPHRHIVVSLRPIIISFYHLYISNINNSLFLDLRPTILLCLILLLLTSCLYFLPVYLCNFHIYLFIFHLTS